MGFTVNQVIRESGKNYVSPVGFTKIAFERQPVVLREDTGNATNFDEGLSFRDPALELTEPLTVEVPYLLRFSITLDTQKHHTFNIKLQKDLTTEADSSGAQVAERTIKKIITPFGIGVYTLDVVFSTKENDWTRIVFEKYREADDYDNEKILINNNSINGWTVQDSSYYNGSWLPVDAESVQLSLINELIAMTDSQSSINKIGIQGPPGMIFTLDNEGLKIGKTGIYQISYDTLAVKRIGVAPEENDFFIIDYRSGFETSSSENINNSGNSSTS